MDLSDGEAIAKQAQEFVLCNAVPILGPLPTTKVHKLLAHLLEAVRTHSNIMNGDTSHNEQRPMDEKGHYARTNKSTSGFLGRLTRHAQSSRAVLKRNADARAALSAATDAPPESDGDSDGYDIEEEDRHEVYAQHVVEAGADAVDVSGGAVVAHRAVPAVMPVGALPAPLGTRTAATHLRQVTVVHLSTFPGLAGVGALLGVPPGARMRMLNHVHFVARVPGGFCERQLVRASPMHRGASWYNWLAYSRDRNDTGAPECFAQVRALVRQGDEDVAIVAELVSTGKTDGPLTSRGCTHLRWAWDGYGHPSVRNCTVRLLCVPVKRWNRVVLIVPDFADLLLRSGVGVTPTELGGPVQDLFAQRFMLNAFAPSRGMCVRETDRESVTS